MPETEKRLERQYTEWIGRFSARVASIGQVDVAEFFKSFFDSSDDDKKTIHTYLLTCCNQGEAPERCAERLAGFIVSMERRDGQTRMNGINAIPKWHWTGEERNNGNL